MESLISCIVPTKSRPGFLKQAMMYFNRQTYPYKEMIIVDDGKAPSLDKVLPEDNIHYIHLDTETNLGEKLNLGIEAAAGQIIQKWDDDDYYGPRFLEVNINSLLSQPKPCDCIVCHDRFLVFLVTSRRLKITEPGWCAGSTLCFQRSVWEQSGFREDPLAVDWSFLRDHSQQQCKIDEPELHIVVRHYNHTWKKIGGQDVDEFMRQLPDYPRTLAELIGEEDAQFYYSLEPVCALEGS